MSILRMVFVTTLCAALLAVQAAGSNVILLPGENGSTTTANAYAGDPVSSLGSFAASEESFLATANIAGSRYYVLAKSGTDTLLVLDSLFDPVQQLDLGVPATSMALTSDGRRLLVLAGQLKVYDTSGGLLTDITPSPAPAVGSNPVDLAISHDSKRVFVLSSASRKLTALNLTTLAVAGSVSIPGISTAVAVAPNGLVYVSAQNRIYEVDGQTVTLRGQIALNGQPGPLSFSPDGLYAVAPNQTPITGKSVWYFDIANLSEASYFSNFGDVVDKIVVTSTTKAYGFSSSTGRLFVITMKPATTSTVASLNMDEATFSSLPGDHKFHGVTTLTASDEVPQAKFLYVATTSPSLARANLVTSLVDKTVTTSAVALSASFAGPAGTGVPASVMKFNDNLGVAPGATTLPLVVRVMNNAGRPLAGVPVTYSTAAPGVTLPDAITTTNAQGFAQVRATTPTTPGQITVNVDIGGGALTTSFKIIVGEGPSGETGGLSIASGNGQVVRYSFLSNEPMKIRLVDPVTGTPLAAKVVKFQVTEGSGTVMVATGFSSGGGPISGTSVNVKTNSQGYAGVTFIGTALLGGHSYEQEAVTASYLGGSVEFTVITVMSTMPGTGLEAPFPTVRTIKPDFANRKITGRVGETIPAAIKVSVFVTAGPESGQGLPGVGLTVSTGLEPAVGPTAACAGGTVLTDGAGVATCDVVIGPKVGNATLQLNVGSFNNQPPISLTVLPGVPSRIDIVQGNNQTGGPGELLPIPLLARIVDAGGNPMPGATAQWEVVTTGTATLSEVTTIANATGHVSARATLGSIAGPVQIRVRSGTATATFTLTVIIPVGGIQKISGDGQTTLINSAFAQSLVVKVVDQQGNPVSGAPVTFVVTAGSASVSPGSVNADAQGLASASVTAGATPGSITVNASSGGFFVEFSLTSIPPGPVVTLAGVRNAISGDPGVTPGGIIAIYGSGLAPGINGSVAGWHLVGPLPTRLADVEVMFGAISAPIYSVNNINGQQWVVVQAPFELTAPGAVSVKITVGGGSTTVNDVPVKTYQPGIFETLGPSGERYAILMKEDGSYVSPASPATRGSKLRMFIGGVGQTNPATGTNRAGVPSQAVLAKLVVGINHHGVNVISAETMVGAVGVYIVTFQVPAETETGPDRPFAIAVFPEGGAPTIFGNPSTIAIQ